MDAGTVSTVVGLLGACLVALLLVVVARRDAASTRARAEADRVRAEAEVAAQREELRQLAAEGTRREERLVAREAALAAERADVAQAAKEARTALERSVEAERAARDVAAEARTAADALLRSAEDRAAAAVATARATADELVAEARRTALAEVAGTAGLTVDGARDELERRLLGQATQAAAAAVRKAEATARRTARARALRIVATAVQRTAVATSSQVSVVTLPLPSPELKGRIIGKEGRNIRSFEALTGVNVLVDETPGQVVLSCFDAERRETAQVALEALLLDGRISPPRIEHAYRDALAGADERAEAAGHAAAERAGVTGLDAELVRTLGRLRLRTSYGQNVLEHLVECALLAAAMAAEVGADVETARRGAFLHDVGKALTAELPGTHAELGAALVRRCGEVPAVVNAVAAHHDEVPVETVEGVLVQAADAISAARPGARHDELDQFVERMGNLEALVAQHAGVRRALAMSAGREVRVVVEPSEVTDEALSGLAEAIARHIEQDLSYPGEITVTVVRELRASATAG